MERRALEEEWAAAATVASNLGELLATLGMLIERAKIDQPSAMQISQRSVMYADLSHDPFWRMASRVAHADTLVEAGDWNEAQSLLIESETMQREQDSVLPLHYSVRNHSICAIRLAQGRLKEVHARSSYSIQISNRNKWLLDVGLDTMYLGLALSGAAQTSSRIDCAASGGPAADTAARLCDTAIDCLRSAGDRRFLVLCLLTRAAYFRHIGSENLSAKDLIEAHEIAERGSMRLFLADCWIESARQRLARSEPTDAAIAAAEKALVKAEEIVEETGYNRRDPDLALVRAELALAKTVPPPAGGGQAKDEAKTVGVPPTPNPIRANLPQRDTGRLGAGAARGGGG